MSAPETAGDGVARVNLTWLIRLRWLLLVGEGFLVLWAATRMRLSLPVAPLLALVVAGLLSNAALALWASRRQRVRPGLLSAVMATDAVLLTSLLALSGGASNPFSTLYLVHVALGAVVLSPRGCWGQLGLSLVGFGSLFLLERVELPGAWVRPSHAEMMRLHVGGMWVAFALSALLIVSFVLRVKGALAERDEELVATRAAHARRARIASLGTLAAGAAHELATPLSTIAVVARELEGALRGVAAPPEVQEDLRLVREQVERCRRILGQMSADLGHPAGEPPQLIHLGPWAQSILEALPADERAGLNVRAEVAADAQVRGPPRALGDALRRLLKNARQASEPGAPIELTLGQSRAEAWIAVSDRGAGMDESLLAHAGEPFFTTKDPGEGMGLGLFITRTLMEQLGGDLTLHSRPGQGTTARLRLPLAGGEA